MAVNVVFRTGAWNLYMRIKTKGVSGGPASSLGVPKQVPLCVFLFNFSLLLCHTFSFEGLCVFVCVRDHRKQLEKEVGGVPVDGQSNTSRRL